MFDALPGTTLKGTVLATLQSSYRPPLIVRDILNDPITSNGYEITIDTLGDIKLGENVPSEGYKTNIISHYIG